MRLLVVKIIFYRCSAQDLQPLACETVNGLNYIYIDVDVVPRTFSPLCYKTIENLNYKRMFSNGF